MAATTTTSSPKSASISRIMKYFSYGTKSSGARYSISQFRKDWDELPDVEKAWFKDELGKLIDEVSNS
jgi:hypothetical protein